MGLGLPVWVPEGLGVRLAVGAPVVEVEGQGEGFRGEGVGSTLKDRLPVPNPALLEGAEDAAGGSDGAESQLDTGVALPPPPIPPLPPGLPLLAPL